MPVVFDLTASKTTLCCFDVSGSHEQRLERAEKRMEEFMTKANEQIDAAVGYGTKAAFVTFNTQQQREACEAACPKRRLAGCHLVFQSRAISCMVRSLRS